MLKTKKFDLKALLSLFLMFVLTFALFALTACGNNNQTSTSSSNSSSISSPDEKITFTDYQTITNGDFEFSTDTTEADDFPIGSGIGWTRANDSLSDSAHTSKKLSGIINTEDSFYDTIKGDSEQSLCDNPHTPYYYGLINTDKTANQTFDRNPDEDVKNPDKLPTTGSNVLMIHNVNPDANALEGRGTAQKFTSTSNVTVPVDSYSKLSLWILTKDLKTVQDTKEFGAYVKLTNTVSSTVAPLFINNINTNGEWAQLNIYIKGNSITSSSYKIVLGLGTGSKNAMAGYVEGFAFFDNVSTQTITKQQYLNATSTIVASENQKSIYNYNSTTKLYETAEKLDVNAYTTNEYVDNGTASQTYKEDAFTKLNYSLDFDLSASQPQVGTFQFGASSVNKDTNNNNLIIPSGTTAAPYDAITGYSTFEELKNVESEYKTEISALTNPMGNSAETLYIIHPSKASSKISSENFVLEDGESIYLSFYVYVKQSINANAATISIVEMDGDKPVKGKNSSTTLSTKDYKNEDTNNWVKFGAFITNDIGDSKQRSFKLTFDLGPTAKTTDETIFPKGYALFSSFTSEKLTSEQYAMSGSSNYSLKLSLGTSSSSESVDNYNFNHSAGDKLTIENTLSTSVIGYTGVVGNHKMVNEDSAINAYSQEETKSGVFNTKYIDNYTSVLTAAEITSIKGLYEDLANHSYQGLLIKNSVATSFGYLGSSNTIPSNTQTMITVKLKVFGNAKANVYLASSDSLDRFKVLGLATDDTHNYNYVQTITASECTDGWMEVNFIITAGENDIDYRVEIWNGERSGETGSEGLIVVDSVNTTSSPDLNALISRIKATYSDNGEQAVKYTRKPSTVKKTDENGNEYTETRHYSDTEVFKQYLTANTIIADHSTIDVSDVIDETTPIVDSTSNNSAVNNSSSSNKVDWGLQITSIAITFALVIAVIAIVIHSIRKSKKKEIQTINEYYNRDSRELAQQKIAEKRARAKAEKLAKEQAEAEELAREQAEAERLAKEQAEAERLAIEQAKAEELARVEAEAEQLAKKQAEATAETQETENANNDVETAETPVGNVETAETPVENVETAETPVENVETAETPVENVETAETPVENVETAETPVENVETAESAEQPAIDPEHKDN